MGIGGLPPSSISGPIQSGRFAPKQTGDYQTLLGVRRPAPDANLTPNYGARARIKHRDCAVKPADWPARETISSPADDDKILRGNLTRACAGGRPKGRGYWHHAHRTERGGHQCLPTPHSGVLKGVQGLNVSYDIVFCYGACKKIKIIATSI